MAQQSLDDLRQGQVGLLGKQLQKPRRVRLQRRTARSAPRPRTDTASLLMQSNPPDRGGRANRTRQRAVGPPSASGCAPPGLRSMIARRRCASITPPPPLGPAETPSPTCAARGRSSATRRPTSRRANRLCLQCRTSGPPFPANKAKYRDFLERKSLVRDRIYTSTNTGAWSNVRTTMR